MTAFDLMLKDNVAIITMNSGENRLNPTFLKGFLKILDQTEKETHAKTLVVQSGDEKIFCNGIDLEWLAPVLQKKDIKSAKKFFYQWNDLFKRLLLYPMITIAGINGHAFAGGAILSCAFDFRFMRSDRGFFCLPEVDLGIPFLPGMNAILKKAIPRYKLEELEYTGNRMTAYECQEHHLIVRALQYSEFLDEILSFARKLNKERSVIQEIKKRMNHDIVHCIDTEDPPYIESGVYNINVS
jgi:enoyl-CoA hydratase/carnithine racemase